MADLVGPVNWASVFTPQAPLAEILVRGSLMYLVLFVLLRLTPARETGALNTSNLLVMVLLADASQNAMVARHDSVVDGVLIVATIVGWSVVLDWLGYHVPWLHRLLRTPPVRLVRDGRILRANLRREMMTQDELMAQLREHGVEAVEHVKGAWIEADGRVSVTRRPRASAA
jgi:uncharacterized membrane protein YcaP (DUF421 family)